jgi:peroxiredoxin
MKKAVTAAFLVLFVVFSLVLKTELRREKSPLSTIKIGETMPDFSVVDLTGKTVKFSDVTRDKKVVLLNFWASWCGPCRVEMPGFEKLYNEQKGNGFALIAIAEDKERSKLDEYLKKKPVSFLVLLDSDNVVAKQFKIEGLPTNVLIGEGGKVRQVEEGVQPYLRYAVEAALKHPEPK